MATLSTALVGPYPVVGLPGQVHTSALNAVGTRAYDAVGNGFVYLKGVANTAVGVAVTYDEAYLTTLLAGNAIGPVAWATGATIASTWGWYQDEGVIDYASTDTIAADKPMFIDGTAGRIDDAVVTGDLILNCFSQTADTTNVATIRVNRPNVTDALG